ncbi:MAG: exopolysaccharide biosynthesis polyprenyl glycosylphosphotransferase [Lachnospiraceae bacterium]|nr:exopolysaccharide biosynthesis polyprenyl glycosylphosphotransferase [Lachnospiraceae bacterium]
MKGNIFLMFMYMGLSYIFMILFDCNALSEYRPATLIFSEMLSITACNILVYFVIIIPAAALGLMPILPIILLTISDFIVIILWALIVNLLLKKLLPPKELLCISSKSNLDLIIYKFIKRNDIFIVRDKIEYNENNLEYIYNKCNLYNDILIGDITSEARNDIIKHCFNNSRNIYVIPKISDILLKYSDDLLIFDTPLFLSSNFGLSIELKIIKRLIDIIFSLFVIICFMPIWIIVAIIIKLEDKGPIFFTQERVTINKKLFKIIKFRSMKVSNSDRIIPTIEEDDRITKIGKFIRKFHIDEVPQFINVLLGDMSIVGPRPERKEHVELYSKEIVEFDYRYKVKAGITGLAQIYGKYNTSPIDKLKLDLVYIKKCSLMFDLELIMRTLKVLVISDNTEGFDIKTKDYIMNNAK